ncbi:MAG: tetratricopeptide repeat protein [Isosphaeraceae bacterium]
MLRGREPNPPALRLSLLPEGAGSLTEELEKPRTRLEPDEVTVHLDLADQLVRAGHYETALRQLDRVLAGDPENVKARYDRAMILSRLKRDPRLIHRELMLVMENPRVDRMVRNHPATVYAFHLAANSLLDQGKVEEADEVARRGLRLSERYRSSNPAQDLDLRARSHYMLALVSAKRTPPTAEASQEALSHLKSARELSPGFVDASLPRNPVLRQIEAEAAGRP